MDSRLHPSHGSSQTPFLAFTRVAALRATLVLLRARKTLATSFIAIALVSVQLLAAPIVVGAPKPLTYQFHIDAGDASSTLPEFSRQSAIQVLYDYNVVHGVKTRPVIGEQSPEAALRQMLGSTSLIYDFVNDHTLAVTVTGHATPGSAGGDKSSRLSGRSQSVEVQRATRAGSGSAELGADPRDVDPDQVTILGTYLRGTAPLGEHVTQLERRDIENNPAATVQDLLRTIPQTWGGGPSEDTHYFSAETASNSGLGAGINLRGLGAGATLVLIDGKRMAPSGTEAAFSDIESIPLAAVERVDILTDGASALYGSDAVGGVVNFVMRDNFAGAETLARRGTGTQDTLEEYQVAQTIGSRWDSGSGMVSVEFYRRGDLPASARRYANSDLTSLGGSNFDTSMSNPGTLIAGGQSYAIPSGQGGTHLTAAQLTPGTQNLTNAYKDRDLLPAQKRWSMYSSGKESLSDAISMFGVALLSRREADLNLGGVGSALTVPSSNPFYVNPSGSSQPVAVYYNFLDDLGPERPTVTVGNINVTLGLNLDLGADWKMSLYGSYAQETQNQFTTGSVDSVGLAAALADPNPETAFNPFGDGSHTNSKTLNAIESNVRFLLNSKLRSLNATANGAVTHLPGGDIQLAVGMDRRNQSLYSCSSLSSASDSQTVNINTGRNVIGAFGELKIPLFGKDNARPALQKLEFSVAGRYEDYSDFGTAATPKLAVAWSPLAELGVRGTWGRSIRAPTLSDLDTAHNNVASFVLPDAASPTGFSRVLAEAGNRPGITMERARTWTGGFDVDASAVIPGLSFSTTYFNIDFRDRILGFLAGVNVLNDPTFATLITRDPSAALIASVCNGGTYRGGSTGCAQSDPTVVLDLRNQNLARVHTSGVDLNTRYERSWAPGTLRVRLDGTYLLNFSQRATPDSSTVQLLNTQNNPINIKLRGTIDWQQAHWGAMLGINFQNSYRDTISVPNRNISSYTTFDMQLRYSPPTFGTSLLQDTFVELSASNVFNSSPPFLNNSAAQLGYDQENADPTGRLIGIQVRKSW
jgi:iron complex outermembrane receptor protein